MGTAIAVRDLGRRVSQRTDLPIDKCTEAVKNFAKEWGILLPPGPAKKPQVPASVGDQLVDHVTWLLTK